MNKLTWNLWSAISCSNLPAVQRSLPNRKKISSTGAM